MDVMSSMKETFTKTADRVIKVSNEVVDLTKANYAVSSTKSAIGEVYKKIGMEIYDLYVSGEMFDETITNHCVEIGELNEKLEELKAKLREIKKVKICPDCSKENPQENKFCSYCGAKMEETE